MPPLQQNESESWRILLFGQNGNEMLLFRSALGFRLPELSIPRWQRAAQHLNTEAKRLWNVETVCISPLEVSDCASSNARYYVMELHRPEEWATLVPCFIEMTALKAESFVHLTDYAAIQKMTGTKRSEPNGEGCGPFADLGSFKRISSWVTQEVGRLGHNWDGDFCQLHSAASFALIRFSTNRGAVWFKAVGEPNLREFPVTAALGALFPRRVPEPLATQMEWNAWLTAESSGHELSTSLQLTDWCQAADSLAALQIDSIQESKSILGAGAHDLRSQQLLETASPFFSAMERVMDAQSTTTSHKLSREELVVLREHVTEAVQELEAAGIPQTLNHLDLNPSNVFVADGQCTFLDWAEAAFGNPFLSFQYFLQHFLRSVPDGQSVEKIFREAYLGRWTPMLSSQAVDEALRLTPLIAVFAYAVAMPWSQTRVETKPQLSGFLRSLVRRMNRESTQIANSGAA